MMACTDNFAGNSELRPALDGQGVLAAFTYRNGGVSTGPYASRNMSFLQGDDPGRVRHNRMATYASLQVDPAQVVQAEIEHGVAVRKVTASDAGRGSLGPDVLPAADILITSCTDVVLLMTAADCVPLLLFDPQRGSLGLVHAGWRGTYAHVARVAVEAMADAYGTRPADIRAVTGPSAGPCCYEVEADVVELLSASHPSALRRRGSLVHFDLWSAIASDLQSAGVPWSQHEIVGVCTVCADARFFSHRRNKGRPGGRFAALAALR